jgi:hypothetical protein
MVPTHGFMADRGEYKNGTYVLQCQQAPLRQPWFSRKKNLTILENKNLGGNPDSNPVVDRK